jgi:hypothetical protein
MEKYSDIIERHNDDLISSDFPEVKVFQNLLDSIFWIIVRGDWDALSDMIDILDSENKPMDTRIPLTDNIERMRFIN